MRAFLKIARFLLIAAASVAALLVAPTVASADGGGDTTIVCDPTGCHVVVVDPGGGGNSGGPGGPGSPGGGGCKWQGKTVACSDPALGSFDSSDGCYYKEASPYPTSGPVYESWKAGGGGIYWASCPFGNGSGGYVWRPTPPANLPPSPAELAKRALDSLTLTKPTTGRYPSGTLKNGQPYTVVHAYTWYYTDPDRFKTLTARAAAGGNWAEVTVKPTGLTFNPGDGRGTVRCNGPGTPWNSSFGVWAASPSGCDYQYPHSSIHEQHQEVTATYGIEWTVSWVGSDGPGTTTLTVPPTTATSTFAVAEVEAVVTR